VLDEFIVAAKRIADRVLQESPERHAPQVNLGDARCLGGIGDSSIDLVVTSPPYLNAIDYLRGHRLALVWLGYSVPQIREIRGRSIGTERGLTDMDEVGVVDDCLSSLESLVGLSRRVFRIYRRYASDLNATLVTLYRVLKQGGRAVLVMGNSTVEDVYLDNALLAVNLAESTGFSVESRVERELDDRRRYLPPPSTQAGSLGRRMRREVVLTIRKM
jgi:DNA modification methylase